MNHSGSIIQDHDFGLAMVTTDIGPVSVKIPMQNIIISTDDPNDMECQFAFSFETKNIILALSSPYGTIIMSYENFKEQNGKIFHIDDDGSEILIKKSFNEIFASLMNQKEKATIFPLMMYIDNA